MINSAFRTRLATIALALALPTLAFAQAFPNKPIHLIIPFPPGGTTDIVGRLVAEKMAHELGQNVIVENRGGGGGAIGALEVARAAPDGYTLGMGTVSTMAVNPACNPKLAYDPLKDFVPITDLAHTANVIVVNPKVPAQNMKEFVALLKANPGKYSYATSGTCGINHMLGEQFKVTTGTFIVHIPYRGSGPALNDTLGGQVEIMLDNLPSSISHIQAGKLRALAVAWPTRIDSLPNIPTFKELGMLDMNDPAWYGLLAPAKTPPEIVNKIQQAAAKVLSQPEIGKRLREVGAEPIGNKPDEYGAEIKRELNKMVALVKRQNIRFEQ